MDPTFLIMYEHKGGLTPSLFAKNVWELGAVTPQNEACILEFSNVQPSILDLRLQREILHLLAMPSPGPEDLREISTLHSHQQMG